MDQNELDILKQMERSGGLSTTSTASTCGKARGP